MSIIAPETSHALFTKHQETLSAAVTAIHERTFYAKWIEAPSKRVYGETAMKDGISAYKAQVGNSFALRQDADRELTAAETSPYTLEAQNINYPGFSDPKRYIEVAEANYDAWRKTDVYTRAGILTESLEAISKRFFELCFATMHTTGQGFMMAFQASGPHSNDRALEAIAMGLHEQTRFPGETEWVKPAGKDRDGNKMFTRLKKQFRNVPMGVSLAIGCSTFPVWNTVPGIYASLVTGNPVIVKPHPTSVYPIAMVVQELQLALQANGFDAGIVQLAVDTPDNLITKQLADDPAVKLIDYTGGNSFGDYIESLPGKRTFTEKAGINSVVLHSTDNVKATMQNIAFSLSLYSGQMCTCPQNIFIPKDGIDTPDGKMSYEDTVATLAKSVQKLVTHEKLGPGTLGAIQNPATFDRVKDSQAAGFKVILESLEINNPDFPKARIATPAIMEVPADNTEALSTEMFGPIVYVIPVDDYKHGVRLAREMATQHGALTFSSWCVDEAAQEYMIDEMTQAYVSVAFNFAGPIWANQSAGFSDFHVTGGNPAGNASLTDPEFVLNRFEIVGVRINQG